MSLGPASSGDLMTARWKNYMFRLHLSTCVILMFVTGTVVMLNVVTAEKRVLPDTDGKLYEYSIFGWPKQAFYVSSKEFGVVGFWWMDLATWLLLIVGSAAISEWAIRRRYSGLADCHTGTAPKE